MRKLKLPIEDPMEVYDTCVAAISDAPLRQTYVKNKSHMVSAVATFDAATTSKSWANLPRVQRGKPERVIFGNLTKKHLVDLYSDYMVEGTGASRKIYDDLLVGAGGSCPFCGGLGQVKTLDHYLPKSNFPAYSVLPANLIPCCRDCNTGKNSSFGLMVQEQTLHPYLDDDKYFGQRWIFAEIANTDPIGIRFQCAPPKGWPNVDKLRVKKHFKSYGLSYRFSVQAGAELGKLIDLRLNSLRGLTPLMFRAFLFDNANSAGFDLNGWTRTMYAALAETSWFYEHDFANITGV